MIFSLTSIVLAARFEVVPGLQFKLIIWLVLKRYGKYSTRKSSFQYVLCLFFENVNVQEMKN